MVQADVAVVIPVRNRPGVVLDTLDSVAGQTLLPRRLVVVDDGSTDDTAAAVSTWMGHSDPAIETLLLRSQGEGVSAARNRGARHRGDCGYLVFLDSDDLWPVDFLGRTVSRLATDSKAVAVSCDRLAIHYAKGRQRLESLRAIETNPTRWLFTHHAGVASCTLFRSAAIAPSGGFKEQLDTGEDAELFLRLSLTGRWLYAAGAPVTFRAGFAAAGEADNITHRNLENNLIWAKVYEEFAETHDMRDLIPLAELRHRLAHRWYRAGRQLARSGRTTESQQCFRRSCCWRTWNKAWIYRALGVVRSA